MINYKNEVVELLYSQDIGLEKEVIEGLIEIPPEYHMGDYAFPCFSLAKVMRKNPNMISEEIAKKLESKYFEKIENVGPYINFFIDKEIFMADTVSTVLDKKERYGSSNIGKGKNIVIEYSSTNIAKPFHIGHIRSTVIGDSLKKIFKFGGYNVTSINYLGDYGTQFGVMISAYKKWGDKEKIDRDPINELLSLYVRYNEAAKEDESLMDEARDWFFKLENGDEEAVKIWSWFKELSLEKFQKVYDLLDIEFDNYHGESYNSQFMPWAYEELEKKGLLEESEGAIVINMGEDEPPAIIKKSNGSSTYITRDVATAMNRKRVYDFDKNIYVVASQQNLHFKQLREILSKMGYDWANDCVHVPFGMVSMEDGSMSTREGRVVFLEDVLNKSIEKTKVIMEEKNPSLEGKDEISKIVGIGAVKFQELFNNRIKDYTFNWDEVLNFDGETGPYVQYTFVRAKSIFDKSDFNSENIDFSKLNSDEEITLTREIYNLVGAIDKARIKYEPSIITRQLINIASAFNKFYNSTHIINNKDLEEKNAQLALVLATMYSIKNGLSLLGIKTPERM